MLGANIGAALIVKDLSFDVSWVSPLLLTAGYSRFGTAERVRSDDIGPVR